MKQVSIILVNWNGWRDTVECLESLLKLDCPNIRIVVCDNASTDDSIKQIRSWALLRAKVYAEYSRAEAEAGGDPTGDPLLTLIRNEANLGFAGGNNVGLRYALALNDSDYFWMLNNDTVVLPDSLSRLTDRMKEDQRIGICGSTILHFNDRSSIQALGGGHYCRWIGLPWHYGRFTRWRGIVDRKRAEVWMNYVEGASMLVSRSFLKQVGLMCEDYFLYFEEADWALRAREHFSLGYAPDSVIYHKVGKSIGSSSNPAKKSLVCDYYNICNRIRFTRRFYPAALPTVYLVLLAEILLRILFGKTRNAVMIFRLMLNGGNDLEDRP